MKEVEFPPFSIGNHKIEEKEYEKMLRACRHEISAFFRKKYGISPSKLSWDRPVEGEVPLECLMEAAIARIKARMDSYILAVEEGVLSSPDLTNLLQRMQEENKKRKEACLQGKVIYGLAEFSFETYLAYEEDALEKIYCHDHKTDHAGYLQKLEETGRKNKIQVNRKDLYEFTLQQTGFS